VTLTPARSHVVAATALIGVVAALASCSNTKNAIQRRPNTGSGTASIVDGTQRVTIVVDDHYRFEPSSITVHPGTVTITLEHKGTGAPHDLQVVGFPSDRVPLVTHGQTVSSTFTTPAPGRYEFVCTIHQALGQTGTLVVLPS
jgi:plastocyanin